MKGFGLDSNLSSGLLGFSGSKQPKKKPSSVLAGLGGLETLQKRKAKRKSLLSTLGGGLGL